MDRLETASGDAMVTTGLLDVARAATDVEVGWALIGDHALRVPSVGLTSFSLDVLVVEKHIERLSELLIFHYRWTETPSSDATEDITLKSPLRLSVQVIPAKLPLHAAMIGDATKTLYRGVSIPVAPLGGMLLAALTRGCGRDLAAVEQVAEHLSRDEMADAVAWGMTVDQKASHELETIIQRVKRLGYRGTEHSRRQ